MAAVLAVVVLGAGCSKNEQASTNGASPTTAEASRPKYTSGPADGATPVDGGKLSIGLEAETEVIDPDRVPFAVSGHMVASAIFDPLMTLDDKGEAMPYLATSVAPNADFTVWTIGVRKDVTFHDGTALTAAVIKQNLEAFKAGTIGSVFQLVSAVSVVDAEHVQLTITQPWVSLPQALTSQAGYVLSPSMLTAADPGTATPVGTGPFKFDSRSKNEYWRLKKNPNYWQKGLPHLDDLEFRLMPDEVAREKALADGTVDMIHTNKPDQVQSLKSSNYKIVDYDNGERDYLTLNTEKPPFNSIDARRAVAYATDYEYWRTQLQKGVKPKATGPFSPGQPGYEEDTGFPTFDLEKAKGLVQKYEKDAGQPLAFDYYARDDTLNVQDAQALAAMWEKAGMKVNVIPVAQLQLIAHVVTGGYQLGEWRLFGDPNPDFIGIWLNGNSIVPPPGISLNFARFKDQVIDDAADKAFASTDVKVRDEAWKTVGRRLADQVPYIWLGRVDWILAANPHVNGIYPAANGSLQTLGPKTWIAGLWLSRS